MNEDKYKKGQRVIYMKSNSPYLKQNQVCTVIAQTLFTVLLNSQPNVWVYKSNIRPYSQKNLKTDKSYDELFI